MAVDFVLATYFVACVAFNYNACRVDTILWFMISNISIFDIINIWAGSSSYKLEKKVVPDIISTIIIIKKSIYIIKRSILSL